MTVAHSIIVVYSTEVGLLREELLCGYGDGDILNVLGGYLIGEMLLEYQGPKAVFGRF